MDKITRIIKKVDEEEAEKVNWTKVWSSKYPVLKTYQEVVDINKYAREIRRLFNSLQKDYGYSELDSMLVLKDILAHEYLDNKRK